MPQINNLSFHLKKLLKEEQNKPKTSRRKKIIKSRTEKNYMENRKTIQKINETKSQFFGEINKINNPLASRTKREETNYSNRKERAKSLDTSFNERVSKSVYPYNCILYSNRPEQIYLCLKVIEGHKRKQSQYCPVNF